MSLDIDPQKLKYIIFFQIVNDLILAYALINRSK